MSRTAVIVDAVRTPSGKGKPGGALSSQHPVDLAAFVLTSLLERSGLESAQVDDVIELILAPALDTLNARISAGESGSYDMGFIDADKTGYDAYYERALRLVRPGGLIALDNTLWSGRVIDDEVTDKDTQAIRALNAKLADDERVTLCLLPVSDGVTLARHRTRPLDSDASS